MTGDQEPATVVVVDDERDVAELYTTWLTGEYDVCTAFGGDEALQTVDDTVDVLLLDRQMPGRTGDDVLEEIDRRGIDCRVVMVTAVDPDFDIVEMPFDDYLTKPVTRDDLLTTVEEMLTRDSYDEQVQQFFAMASKKATLESEKSRAALDASGEYRDVSRRVERLREEADEAVTEFDSFETAFRELSSGD